MFKSFSTFSSSSKQSTGRRGARRPAADGIPVAAARRLARSSPTTPGMGDGGAAEQSPTVAEAPARRHGGATGNRHRRRPAGAGRGGGQVQRWPRSRPRRRRSWGWWRGWLRDGMGHRWLRRFTRRGRAAKCCGTARRMEVNRREDEQRATGQRLVVVCPDALQWRGAGKEVARGLGRRSYVWLR